MKELLALLGDHQLFHSDLQMDCFITAKEGGTPYGQYRQALRELHKRYGGLKELYTERELAAIDLDELSQESKPSDTEFDERRRKVRAAQARMKLDGLARTVADSEREFRRFYAQAMALKKTVGELTPGRRRELDLKFWLHRLKTLAALDVLAQGRVGPSVIALWHCLPAELRRSLWAEIQPGREAGLVSWYLNEDSPSVVIDEQLLADERPLMLP